MIIKKPGNFVRFFIKMNHNIYETLIAKILTFNACLKNSFYRASLINTN